MRTRAGAGGLAIDPPDGVCVCPGAPSRASNGLSASSLLPYARSIASLSVSRSAGSTIRRLLSVNGKLRKTALMRVEHEGVYAVVASLGGAPKNPVWYYNLKKNPHVELQDGATKLDYNAREATGDEKALWWERAVEAWPDYANYQAKTDRQIPVFVLEPME